MTQEHKENDKEQEGSDEYRRLVAETLAKNQVAIIATYINKADDADKKDK